MGASADSIRVVGEADLLELGRVARSTWQNWVKKDALQESDDGFYNEEDAVEVVVLGLLIAGVELRRATPVWRASANQVLSECLGLPLEGPADLFAVVDVHTWELHVARNADELYHAARAPSTFPRARLVIPLAAAVQEVRRAFWIRAMSQSELAADKRRKARRAEGRARHSQ
jgi:hypothetical protein